MDVEELFYNKELSDVVRDIVKNSTTTLVEACQYLKDSDDYNRDSFIIKKLSNVGIRNDIILVVVKSLSDKNKIKQCSFEEKCTIYKENNCNQKTCGDFHEYR